MDYAIGDELALNIDAIDPKKPNKILFPKGTIVKIESLKGKIVNLKFPDGITYAHEMKDLISIFIKSTKRKILTKNHAGIGTPPKEVFALLPNGSDWKKNYIWKINISLEERNDKLIICQNCTTEITDINKTNSLGDIYCPSCKDYIVPFDIKNNKPCDTNSVFS